MATAGQLKLSGTHAFTDSFNISKKQHSQAAAEALDAPIGIIGIAVFELFFSSLTLYAGTWYLLYLYNFDKILKAFVMLHIEIFFGGPTVKYYVM